MTPRLLLPLLMALALAGQEGPLFRVERVDTGFGFTEGPVWSKAGYLLFNDIPNGRTFKFAGSAPSTVFRENTHAANGNAFDARGRLYSCERDGRRLSRIDADGATTVVADRWEGKRLNSPNDVVVRRDGHIYFTDPASAAVKEPMEIGFNGVYHVGPQGQISLVTRSMIRPNGVALSPDGQVLYVADTDEHTVVAFDLDWQGYAANQRVLIRNIPGPPDGLRTDIRGNLYIACQGIAIYTPAGKRLRMIKVPERPTNCAFGGPGLRTLYITAQKSIYRMRVKEPGALPY